ncbi:DUF4177 domain-containing protein [Persicitalea sp.]|uniref:DUF4177 domain-containing protein n=1 Tax=Persicitalea sp. TaxID=3100273 RepID=UPI0035932A84
MKEYKLESFIYYSKLTLDTNHILNSSTAEIQAKLDEYAKKGWRLASSNTASFGAAVYVYLYFERDAEF